MTSPLDDKPIMGKKQVISGTPSDAGASGCANLGRAGIGSGDTRLKMITSSAPGRVGIIGNPTDIYGGNVISCSIASRAYCRMEAADSLQISVGDNGSVISLSGELSHKGDALDVVKAALRFFKFDPASAGFSVKAHTEVPEQAGLGGSSAILGSVVGCLAAYQGMDLNKYEMAELVRKVESSELRVSCGYQDHYMTVFGGLNHLEFRGKEGLTQCHEEPFATVEPLSEFAKDLPMLIAHTGVMHSSTNVHRSLRERWQNGEGAVVEGYRRISELARQGKKALIMRDWEWLGKLMNENHAIQRDLGGSGESNEKLIKAALDSGALGAKLAGAGGGGTIIALTEKPEATAEALRAAGADKIMRPEPVAGLTVQAE